MLCGTPCRMPACDEEFQAGETLALGLLVSVGAGDSPGGIVEQANASVALQ